MINSNYIINFVCLIFFICYLPIEIFGYEKTDISKNHIIGASDFLVYIDSTNQLSQNDILQQKFVRPTSNAIHASLPNAAYWLKFTINSEKLLTDDWYLEAVDPKHNFIQIFVKDSSDYLPLCEPSGIDFPFRNRCIIHKNFLFKVPNNQEKVSFLAKIQSEQNTILLFTLKTDADMLKYALAEYFWLAIFYGALLSLALYNLMVFIRIGEISYLYFVLYIFSVMLLAFSEDGLGFQYLWPQSPMFHKLVIGLSPIFYMSSFILFGISYLDIKNYCVRFYTKIIATTVLSIIYMLLQWLIASNTWALSFGYLASFLLLYFVVILKMKNGHIIARNFFIAYSFVIIAIFITILRRYALFDITWNSVLWVYIMNIACFIEILLLSFAQTEKFRLKQIEKSKQLRESEQKYRISAQELQQKNVELQHYIASNTELQSFSYAVSHDLKQPLRTISSFATLLERRLQKNNIEDSQIADYLTFIKEGGKNMNSLITDLLEYSKAGNLTNENFVENDFNEIMQRVESNLKNQIEESEAKIIYHNLPTNLRAVSVKMIQLFQNLISNAIKFRDENRALKIEIAVAEKENHYQFEIKDNGMGIEEAHISKIFQVFFKNHENSKTEGSGIGLSLCQKIVVAHGGNIWLTSEKGVGTSFMFTIPKK